MIYIYPRSDGKSKQRTHTTNTNKKKHVLFMSMKWISSLLISIPFVYAIAWDVQLNEVDQSFLILVFLQIIFSMYHRQVNTNLSKWMDQTVICAIWIFLAFPLDWTYCIVISALLGHHYTLILVPSFGILYIIKSEELQVLKLLTGCSGCLWFLYNCTNDVEWTRWIWHGHVGMMLLYALYLHDYAN